MSKVHIDYKLRDGVHCFTSRQLPGFLVAHQDFARAFGDVPRVIEKLIELNEGRAVDAALVVASFQIVLR